jgi:hypothetical protein
VLLGIFSNFLYLAKADVFILGHGGIEAIPACTWNERQHVQNLLFQHVGFNPEMGRWSPIGEFVGVVGCNRFEDGFNEEPKMLALHIGIAAQTKPVSDDSTDKHPKQNEQARFKRFWHDVAFFVGSFLVGFFCGWFGLFSSIRLRFWTAARRMLSET